MKSCRLRVVPVVTPFTALLAMLIALTSVPPVRVRAAPIAPPVVSVAPAELTKVTLPETSPTGPAMWTIEALPSANTYNAVLGWSGTDAAHHVNVLTSVDGLHAGKKMTLGETAISRPAVSVIISSAHASRILVLAWTGTDTRHSLNVLFDVFNVTGHRSKSTFADTSIAGPALAVNRFLAGENLQLAWTGTDANHSLNVRELDEIRTSAGDVTGLTLGPKRTLPSRLRSFAGPELATNLFMDLSVTLITWAQSGTSQLGLADVSDPSSSLVFFSSQTTASRPSLLALVVGQGASAAPHYWWAWTGTDSHNSLNLMDTDDFTRWPGPVTTFHETATGGPALGSVGVANQLLLAWTGTDSAHHLNVATIGV